VSVLIITYAHYGKDTDYEPFFDAIRNNCEYWWHYLDAIWIVVTDHSANDYAEILYPHIEASDRLFVGKLSGEYQGWLPAGAWDWLNSKEY
jgi:hypothetical protein